MSLENIHYDAFISYRHAELDQFVATSLHKKLENFSLPKSVIGKVKNGKTKIERVFRDEDELPLSDNLSDPISNALANSDYLIMICTPRYLESRWCLKEIEVFLQTHDRKDILVVLAEAEPEDSFPEIITYEEYEETLQDGSTVKKRRELEPLAADTRGETRKDILKAMDIAVIKLCAAIFGLNYDDLRQRHREQKMKKMFTIFGAITVVMSVVAIVMMVLMMTIDKQKHTIETQYDELEEKYAGSMAMAADSLLSEGRKMDALYIARSVLPDNDMRGYNAEAYYVLNRALNTYTVGDSYVPLNVYNLPTTAIDYKISADGQFLAAETIDGNIYMFDTKSAKELICIERNSLADYADFAFTSDDILIYADNSKAYKMNPNDLKSSVIIDLDDEVKIYSDENSAGVICIADDYLYGIAPDGSILYVTDLLDAINSRGLEIVDVAFDEDKFVCVLTDYTVDFIVYGDSTGEILISFWIDWSDASCVDIDDGVIYLCQSNGLKSSGSASKIYAIDTESTMTLWIQEGEGFICNDVIVNDGYVYICGDYATSIFETKRGGQINTHTYSDVQVDSYCQDGRLYNTDGKGHVYVVDDVSVNDYTYTLFDELPGRYIMNCAHSEDALYYQYLDSNYIVQYGPFKNEYAEVVDYASVERTAVFDSKSANSAIEKIDDINMDFVKSSFYSDDENVIVIEYLDDTVIFYDANTMEKMNTLYDYNYEFGELKYAEDIDSYILTAYSLSLILNDKLQVIAKTDPVADYKNGEFLIPGENSYTVPYMKYDEQIKRADEILGDYEPSEAIKEKYNVK